MRFFSLEWWCGLQPDDGTDPRADYAAHLDAIRVSLPTELLATEEMVSRHDTRLRELHLSVAERQLTVGLERYSASERFTLTYDDVERFDSVADPEIGLKGPFGYGDLGYYEVDLLPGGSIEHRLLFSSGVELVVVFRGFSFQRSPTGHLE